MSMHLTVGRQWTGQNRFYIFDWQGNLAQTMSNSTTVKSGWAFNAWGQVNTINPYGPDATWDDCFGYNARWGYLKEYGFNQNVYYCQNRYYMADQGRWLTRDPISYSVGSTCTGIVVEGQD
jgi:hypothetical protein